MSPRPPDRPWAVSDLGHLSRLVRDLEAQVLERRRAEDELRKSEERFRLLVERARDIVFRLRLWPAPGFDYISPVAAAITGHTPGEFCRDPGLARRLVHPEDRPLVDDYCARGDYGRPLACRLVHRDGAVVWLEQRSLPIYGPGGRLLAVEGVARDVTEARRLLSGLEERGRALAEKDRLLQEFSARTVRLQEEERHRVARELHDGINQLLCAVGFGLEAACRDAAGSPAAGRLQGVRDLVNRCIEEIRRISDDLRPVVLDDLGLAAAIRSLCAAVGQRAGLAVRPAFGELAEPLPTGTAVTAYRLLQEVLLGLAARPDAGPVEVRLGAAGGHLDLTVQRAGPPGDAPALQAPGLDLDGLGERARLVGGSLGAEPAGAEVRRLRFRLPLPAEAR